MAVSTINPWSAGAVVLDQRPFLAFYERQMAREQAKQDALENYFKDLGKNVTSVGMRSQDVPGLLQMNKAWQDHYIQNKSAILNPKLDNGKAYNEYMSGYQNQIALTSASKDAYKKKEELGKLKFNKDFSYVFDDPDILKKIELDDLPIGDPRRQALDITTEMLPPKPIGIKEKEAFSKYAIGELKPDEIRGRPINIGNFQTQTPITYQYSDQNKKTIGQRAADVYDTDRNWRADAVKMFKEQVSRDPVLHDQLNIIHKRYFGTDVDSPREAFIAKTILDHDIRNIKYEKGEDVYGRQLALENVRFGHQKQLKKEDQGVLDNWIVNYWGQRFADAKSKEPVPLPGPKTPTLTYKMGYQLDPDQVMSEALKKNGIYADEAYITGKNKILPIYYKKEKVYYEDGKLAGIDIVKDENGNPVVDEALSRPMELDQAYLSMGYKGQTKKELGGTMSGVYEGAKKETNKPKRVIQNGHEYILNEKTGQYE